jgi:hypothetical protein
MPLPGKSIDLKPARKYLQLSKGGLSIKNIDKGFPKRHLEKRG